MVDQCKTCIFLLDGWKCNRLVVDGGFGNNDRVASDYIKDNTCNYYKQGQGQKDYSTGSCNSWNS